MRSSASRTNDCTYEPWCDGWLKSHYNPLTTEQYVWPGSGDCATAINWNCSALLCSAYMSVYQDICERVYLSYLVLYVTVIVSITSTPSLIIQDCVYFELDDSLITLQLLSIYLILLYVPGAWCSFSSAKLFLRDLCILLMMWISWFEILSNLLNLSCNADMYIRDLSTLSYRVLVNAMASSALYAVLFFDSPALLLILMTFPMNGDFFGWCWRVDVLIHRITGLQISFNMLWKVSPVNEESEEEVDGIFSWMELEAWS